VDTAEQVRILAAAEQISPHCAPGRQDASAWFETILESDPHIPSGEVVHTLVLKDDDHYGGTSCVFLRFDFRCALQVAGEAISGDPWELKPFYCILHPLDLDEEGCITLDETSLLKEEAASCLVPSKEKFPLTQTFEPELRRLLGDEEYLRLTRVK
jgi:hypothetical protein